MSVSEFLTCAVEVDLSVNSLLTASKSGKPTVLPHLFVSQSIWQHVVQGNKCFDTSGLQVFRQESFLPYSFVHSLQKAFVCRWQLQE